MRKLVLALAACAGISSPALAGYDGLWKINIVTTRGSCDSQTSMALAISNGVVVSRDPSISVSGQVGAGGAISVSLSDRRGSAIGSGRLDATAGFGVWRGGPCAGTWTAQRN